MGKGDGSQTSAAYIPDELKPLYRSTAAQIMNLQAQNPLAGPSAYWSAHGRNEYGADLDNDYYRAMYSQPGKGEYNHPDYAKPGTMPPKAGWSGGEFVENPSVAGGSKGPPRPDGDTGTTIIPPGVTGTSTGNIIPKNTGVSGGGGGGGNPSFDEWLSSLPYSIPGGGARAAYDSIYGGGKSSGAPAPEAGTSSASAFLGGSSLRDLLSSGRVSKKPAVKKETKKSQKGKS